MAKICSEIPEELASMVAERVVCVDDLVRFGAVCKTWRSAWILEKQKKKVYAPVIMLAKAENDKLPSDDINDGEGVRSFVVPYYRDGNKKMRSFDIELPKAQGRRCWGSPYGWVVTVGLDLDIHLLNPLTGEQLPLPPQPILKDQSLFSKKLSILPVKPDNIICDYTSKFILSWHQSSQSWLVMAIFGEGSEVAFTLTGIENQNEPFSSYSSSWTFIDSLYQSLDAILFKDRILIINHSGMLLVSDIKQETLPKASYIASLPSDLKFTDVRDLSDTCYYLVEMGGDLHFVVRYLDFLYDEAHTEYFVPPSVEQHYVTTHFLVWRFNFFRRSWHKLDELGEYALFLGNNTSFAISTTAYPDFSRNSIYFTDDHHEEYNYQFCDMGVYDFGERTVRPFDIANMGVFSKFSRPIFFKPTL